MLGNERERETSLRCERVPFNHLGTQGLTHGAPGQSTWKEERRSGGLLYGTHLESSQERAAWYGVRNQGCTSVFLIAIEKKESIVGPPARPTVR